MKVQFHPQQRRIVVYYMIERLKEYNMANWKYKIDIKQYITDDTSVESMRACYTGIKEEFSHYGTLTLPERFHDLAQEAIVLEDVDVFNNALNELYDWADYKKVWLGL